MQAGSRTQKLKQCRLRRSTSISLASKHIVFTTKSLMKIFSNKKVTSLSRRQFIHKTAAAVSGIALASNQVLGAPAIIRNLNKPNSKFAGVQIGAITYSFRSLPGDAEQILRYCVECNVSAIELMGPTA